MLLVRSLSLVILLALCWGCWHFLPQLLQPTPLALYAPVIIVVAMFLILTFAEWVIQKYLSAYQ